MNRISSMLLGIAIGDAFGAGYEYFPGGRAAVREAFDFTRYRKHPAEGFNHRAGMYTDDTQMSIALARLLISDKEFDHLNLADSFVEVYKKDPIDGYARRFKGLLDKVNSGQEFLDQVIPDSIKNGAAMRAVPLGVVPDLEKVVEYAVINAEITHNTPQGIASSVTVALMSYHRFHKSSQPLLDFILPYTSKFNPETAEHLEKIKEMKNEMPKILFGEENISKGVPGYAMRTVGAVYYILSNYGNDACKTLRKAVLLGGDTDSVASISLGIVGMDGLEDLPRFFYDELTNHVYGRDYLIHLGEKLAERLR